MTDQPKLPRGIWYEEAKKRYRVRKYRNRLPYLVGYYYSLEEATAALAQLHNTLRAIPKARRRPVNRPVPIASFRSMTASMREDLSLDPGSFRKPHH